MACQGSRRLGRIEHLHATDNTFTIGTLGTPTNLDMVCFTTPSSFADTGPVNISVNSAAARPWISNNSAAVQAQDVEASTLYCALYTASGYRFVTDNNVVKGASFTSITGGARLHLESHIRR